MAETLFEELKRYVGFGPDDMSLLRALHPVVRPQIPAIVTRFYDRILAHDGARRALEAGEGHVGRLKITLAAWLDKLLVGPWDEEYFDLRCRIGRVHVRIGLPQHYMFGAMNVLRHEMGLIIERYYVDHPELLSRARRALDRIVDLELAIMLHTYREDMLAHAGRAERLATFGQLVGSLGHELRNPLGVIETSLFIVRQRLGDGDERANKHLDRIGEQLRIATGIINSLLDLIRDRPLQRAPIDIAMLIREAIALVPGSENAQISTSGLESLPAVPGDHTQLRQAIVNLLQNAVQAMDGKGLVRVEGSYDHGIVSLAIEDEGPGIVPEVRARLFEPLITGKAKGVGLGLALVKRIVERHGGTVTHAPGAVRGARFMLTIPLQT